MGFRQTQAELSKSMLILVSLVMLAPYPVVYPNLDLHDVDL